MSNKLMHADGCNGEGRTLCGIADEGIPSDNETTPPKIATPGARITCADCRAIIDYSRRFDHYRQPLEAVSEQS